MGFSAKQIAALSQVPSEAALKVRERNGKTLSYLEGWYVVSEANRIFGFDGWHRETLEVRCLLGRETRGTYQAIYLAKVRLTVEARGRKVIREAHGTGESTGSSMAEAHEIALKAAETDATKRALTTFGNPFGLSLYAARPALVTALSETLPPTNELHLTPPVAAATSDVSEVPAIGAEALVAPLSEVGKQAPPTGIDKSALAFPEPRRRRNKEHLRFVASQGCLICGRHPSDAHHLKFMQPRAMGLKVSDEFTVPLCRTHHRQLHQAGNEAAWWEDLQIDAPAIAEGLWNEGRGQRK